MKSRIDLILPKLVQGTGFLSLLALPWINSVRISTFLFIALGLIFLVKKDLIRVNYYALIKQPFFLIFLCYFALQILAVVFYPEKMNRSALEQKASLLFIPVLFYVMISRYKNSWHMAKLGFITGTILASVACFSVALYVYFQTLDASVFFYHRYAEIIGLSAIYFSLFLVIALIYSTHYFQQYYTYGAIRKSYLFGGISVFLFLNLILLSSKAVLAVGSLLIVFSLLRKSLFSRVQKTVVAAVFILVFAGIFWTENPISNRYKEIKLTTYEAALHSNNFKDFAFDGLNLRLLLWRMGLEIGNENQSWFTGNGGKHFHQVLNEKIKQYSLYTGNINTKDKGYLDYNLHNQYMESYAQFGIPGLILILALMVSIIYYGAKYNNALLIYIALLFGLVFLTESVMERQAGILLLTIFISGEWILTQQKQALKQTI